MMTTLLTRWRHALALLTMICCTQMATAQMRALSEAELSSMHGQGIVAMSNTSLNGFDFSKVSLDADITLSANLRNVRLGEYTYAARNGSGADLDIALLQFGRSDGSEAQRLVHIANPYFEFVYRNAADGCHTVDQARHQPGGEPHSPGRRQCQPPAAAGLGRDDRGRHESAGRQHRPAASPGQ